MAGTTVSTHVDEEIAERVRKIAALEDRKVSRVAGAALALYVDLPGEARDALRHIEALGDEGARDAALREITSVLPVPDRLSPRLRLSIPTGMSRRPREASTRPRGPGRPNGWRRSRPTARKRRWP